jgi:hypothetical protein
MTWVLMLGLFISVNVGMWFYVKAYNRRPSEYQKAFDDLAKSLYELRAAIGEALLPPLTRILDTFRRKDQK